MSFRALSSALVWAMCFGSAASAAAPASVPPTTGAAPSPSTPSTTSAAPAPVAAPADGIPATPLRVYTGLYVNDLAGIDVRQHHFFADFYVWFRAKLRPGDSWTPQFVELMNAVKVDLVKVEEKKLPDGASYWEFRAKGTFRGRFDLARYPMDVQELPIIIEDANAFARKLVFVADPTHAKKRSDWLDRLLEIPQFRVANARTELTVHDYGTTFGDTTAGLSQDLARFSRFAYTVTIERIYLTHLIKFLIPLLVIAGMAYLTFFMKSAEFSTMSRLCGTALLSSIALHITSSRNLPEVGYLLVSDKIFILFYLVIFLTLLEKVIANRWNSSGREGLALRLEMAFRVGFPIFLGLGTALVYVTR